MGQHEILYAMMNRIERKKTSLIKFLAMTLLATQGLEMTVAAPADAATAPPRYGVGLGHLITTEAERKKMDDARFHILPPVVIKEATPTHQTWHLDGVTSRPDQPLGQRVTLWIDGRPYRELELPKGLSLVRDARGKVMGVKSITGKNKIEFAKIGDSITRPETEQEARARQLAEEAQKDAP